MLTNIFAQLNSLSHRKSIYLCRRGADHSNNTKKKKKKRIIFRKMSIIKCNLSNTSNHRQYNIYFLMSLLLFAHIVRLHAITSATMAPAAAATVIKKHTDKEERERSRAIYTDEVHSVKYQMECVMCI